MTELTYQLLLKIKTAGSLHWVDALNICPSGYSPELVDAALRTMLDQKLVQKVWAVETPPSCTLELTPAGYTRLNAMEEERRHSAELIDQPANQEENQHQHKANKLLPVFAAVAAIVAFLANVIFIVSWITG